MKSPESAFSDVAGLFEFPNALFMVFKLLYSNFNQRLGEVLPKKAELTHLTNFHEQNCRPDALCVACALVLVAQHRFTAFKENFGRWPGPDEELFFDGARE